MPVHAQDLRPPDLRLAVGMLMAVRSGVAEGLEGFEDGLELGAALGGVAAGEFGGDGGRHATLTNQGSICRRGGFPVETSEARVVRYRLA